jgi:hypothetical protein
VKRVQSKFGRALYSLLNELFEMEDPASAAKGPKNKNGVETESQIENAETVSVEYTEIFNTVVKEEPSTSAQRPAPAKKAGGRPKKPKVIAPVLKPSWHKTTMV